VERRAGLTLLELMVAFAVFISLMFTLVGISSLVLDTWKRGETLKDTADRAEGILGIVERDLRSIFSERETPWIGPEQARTYLLGAHLHCDLDAWGRPVLKFVRTAGADEMQVRPPDLLSRVPPTDMYTELYEVMYMFRNAAAETTLHRGVQYFNRNDRNRSFFTAPRIDPNSFRPVDDGVLHFELRFWDPQTDRWDAEDNRVPPAARRGQDSSPRWDSSRASGPQFPYYRRNQTLADPDFVYPEMVRIRLILRSRALDPGKVFLLDDISDSASTIRLSTAQGLPDAPGLIRIDGEWIEYSAKDFSTVRVRRRGALGTAKASHSARSEVWYGDEYTRVVYLPVRMEAVRR
jgi:hypothetical protein